MACAHVTMPDGGKAIVCSSHRRQRCACGTRANRACDWKIPTRKSGTCGAPICARCSTSPAPDKDLCPKHAAAFEAWKAGRTAVSADPAPEQLTLTYQG